MKFPAKLLWLAAALVFASSVQGQGFPAHFVGGFADTVPGLTGGTKPDTRLALNCEQAGKCVLALGKDTIASFSTFAVVKELKYARNALAYAKERKDVPAGSVYAWQANNLRPLLASKSEIEMCVDVQNESMKDEYMLLCRLDRDPWKKGTVLLMGTLLANCGELFCRYEIYPLFRER